MFSGNIHEVQYIEPAALFYFCLCCFVVLLRECKKCKQIFQCVQVCECFDNCQTLCNVYAIHD